MNKLSLYTALAACLVPAVFFSAASADVQLVNEEYGDRIVEARSTEEFSDDLNLASELLRAAKNKTSDPEHLAALCDQAFELAVADKAGASVAADALDLWSKHPSHGLDSAAADARKLYKLWQSLPDSSSKPTIGRKLMQSQTRLAEAYTAAKEASKARALERDSQALAAALGVAVSANPTAPASDKKIETLKQKLKADPKNQQALQEILVYYFVTRDDPKLAAEYCAQVLDEQWKTCVPLAAKEVESLKEDEALRAARFYRSIGLKASGETKVAMLTRSETYFQHFLESHGEVDSEGKSAVTALKGVQSSIKLAEKSLEAKRQRNGQSQPLATTRSTTRPPAGDEERWDEDGEGSKPDFFGISTD